MGLLVRVSTVGTFPAGTFTATFIAPNRVLSLVKVLKLASQNSLVGLPGFTLKSSIFKQFKQAIKQF